MSDHLKIAVGMYMSCSIHLLHNIWRNEYKRQISASKYFALEKIVLFRLWYSDKIKHNVFFNVVYLLSQLLTGKQEIR